MAHKIELSFNTNSDNLPQKHCSHPESLMSTINGLKVFLLYFWFMCWIWGQGEGGRLYVRLAGLLASRVCVVQGPRVLGSE